MKARVAVVLGSSLAVVACSNVARAPTTVSAEEYADERRGKWLDELRPVTESVANVIVTYQALCPGGEQSVDTGGTAFNVSYEGIWMTAHHVVAPTRTVRCDAQHSVTATRATIRLLHEAPGSLCEVDVFAHDNAIDAALLVSVPPVGDQCRGIFHPFKLEAAAELPVNEPLSVIGYPSENPEYISATVSSATEPVVARVRGSRTIFDESEWRENMVQAVFRNYFSREGRVRTSATETVEAIMSTPQAIPGQSGSPLVVEKTMVAIGMVVQRAPGKTYSIPASRLLSFVNGRTGKIVFGEDINIKWCAFVRPDWEPVGTFHAIPLSDDTRLRPGSYDVMLGLCEDGSESDRYGTSAVLLGAGEAFKLELVDDKLVALPVP